MIYGTEAEGAQMDDEMYSKLKGICELCRKTGADDSQYILVPIGALEELLSYVPEVKDGKGSRKE